MPRMATRARVGRCNKAEPRWKLRPSTDPDDCHRTILQWLSQGLKHVPGELGQLVEKENATVGHGHFAWEGNTSPSDQTDHGHRMMGSSEWTPEDKAWVNMQPRN